MQLHRFYLCNFFLFFVQKKAPRYNKLQLIALGQAAGFTLDELAAMFGSQAGVTIDRGLLLQRAKEIDATVRKLQLLSRGLKHAARCTQPEHRHCEEFKRVVAKGLRLVG